MAEPQLYISQLAPPDRVFSPIQGLQAPQFDTTTLGAAMSEFGKEAIKFDAAMRHAQQQTKAAVATTGYLTELADLEQRQTENPDYGTAPGVFYRGQRELETKWLGTIPDNRLREHTNLEFRRAGLASWKRVKNVAWTREADDNSAALDAQELEHLKSYSSAGSDVERAEINARNAGSIDAAVNAGWITAQSAVARKQRFQEYLDNGEVMAAIRANPEKAGELLADPKKFQSLKPATREAYRTQAADQADQVRMDRIGQLARFDPPAASLTLGRITDPQHADQIFFRGVIPIESSGNPKAVSGKGALGLSQLMPDTARAQARKLGLTDVANLGDAELRERLLNDEALNVRLGAAEWRELLQRYNGNIALAAAGYNAGPLKADEWRAAAVAKYGPEFTAAQLQSVITYKETRDYLGKLWGKFGAPLDAAGLRPHNQYRAVNGVAAILAADQSAAAAVIKSLAEVNRSTDPLLEVIKQGIEVDPARVNQAVATNRAAAERGDVAAAKYLRDLEQAIAIAPHIRTAWSLPPVELDRAIKAGEAMLFAPGANATQRELDNLAALKAVREEIVKRRDREPIVLGGENGGRFYRINPIDTNAQPEDTQFRAGLAVRAQQAALAVAHYGGKASVFTELEATALKARYENADPNERFRMLQGLAAALPRGQVYQDSVTAIAGGGVLEQTAGRLAVTRPDVAREILIGAELLKSDQVSEQAKLVKPAFSAKLGGYLYPSPEMQSAVEKAALALYVSRAGANFTLYDPTDTTGVERAIEDVAGVIVSRNGARTPAPPGVTRAQFNGVLDNISEAALNLHGGAQDGRGQPLPASFVGVHAVLKPLEIGGSRYVVGVHDPFARDKFAPLYTAGEFPAPLVVDFNVLAANLTRPALTPYQRGLSEFRAGQFERLKAAREGDSMIPFEPASARPAEPQQGVPVNIRLKKRGA